MGVVWGTRAKLGPTTKNQGDPSQTNRFTLEIDGLLVGGVNSIEGLEHEHEIIEFMDGDDIDTHYRPGRKKPGRVKITRDFSATREFMDWRKTVLEGKVQRKSVSIVILSDDSTEAVRYNLFEAWPTKWIGPTLNSRNSSNATESIELAFETMEMK